MLTHYTTSTGNLFFERIVSGGKHRTVKREEFATADAAMTAAKSIAPTYGAEYVELDPFLIDAPHMCDEEEPCYCCGARWYVGRSTLTMQHRDGCQYNDAIDKFEAEADARMGVTSD